MTEHIARQAQDMLAAAAKTEVPAEVRAFAQESVAKTREAFDKWNVGARQSTRVLEEVLLAARTGVKTIGEKALGNALANTEAAFDAAEGVARARTVPEAAQLQARFVQERLAALNAQGKALFELSIRVAKETTDTLAAIATEAELGDLKTVA